LVTLAVHDTAEARLMPDTLGTDDTVDALVLDLLEWIGSDARPYADVMDAWRTSCPRLPVWEEANSRGLLTRHRDGDRGDMVTVSAAGSAYLSARRTPLPG
jgi:hypothetical protein